MWAAIWTSLALGAIGVGWWAWRDLFRRGRALLAELDRAADVFGSLEPDEVVATTPAPPTFDLTEARARRARAAVLTERRRARRRQRHRAAQERWLRLYR